MTVFPAVAAAYQLTIGSLTLGADTDYPILRGPNGFGLADLRTSDVPRPRDHGLFFGSDYFGGRTLTWEIAILGDTSEDVGALIDALLSVWQPPVVGGSDTVVPLGLRLPGQTARVLLGRPRRLAYNLDHLKGATATAVLQYDVNGPQMYAAAETVLTTGPATSGGGRTYPRVYPLVYAAGGSGGLVGAENLGNFPTRPVITITGPATTPRIEHVESGRYLQVNISLAGGEFIVLDTDIRTVMLMGTASRFNLLSGDWFELGPGDNTLRFTTADALGTMEVRWRSAWL